MAHADYTCCAICDKRICMDPYCEEAKTELCARCAVALCKRGIEGIVDVDSLIAWMKKEDPKKVILTLLDVGFRFCFFDNPVDELFVQLLGRFGVVIDRSLLIDRYIPPDIVENIRKRLSSEAGEIA